MWFPVWVHGTHTDGVRASHGNRRSGVGDHHSAASRLACVPFQAVQSSRLGLTVAKAMAAVEHCLTMAKVKNESRLREFAVLGARVRVQELQAEINRIKKQFGGRILLLSGRSSEGTAIGAASSRGVGASGLKRGRRKMSADARRRISEAQKARWAKQRAKKG
jgi:hypothetical protein